MSKKISLLLVIASSGAALQAFSQDNVHPSMGIEVRQTVKSNSGMNGGERLKSDDDFAGLRAQINLPFARYFSLTYSGAVGLSELNKNLLDGEDITDKSAKRTMTVPVEQAYLQASNDHFSLKGGYFSISNAFITTSHHGISDDSYRGLEAAFTQNGMTITADLIDQYKAYSDDRFRDLSDGLYDLKYIGMVTVNKAFKGSDPDTDINYAGMTLTSGINGHRSELELSNINSVMQGAGDAWRLTERLYYTSEDSVNDEMEMFDATWLSPDMKIKSGLAVALVQAKQDGVYHYSIGSVDDGFDAETSLGLDDFNHNRALNLVWHNDIVLTQSINAGLSVGFSHADGQSLTEGDVYMTYDATALGIKGLSVKVADYYLRNSNSLASSHENDFRVYADYKIAVF